MTSLTAAQAYSALRSVGATPTQAALLTAIGEAESGLNPSAVGDTTLQNATWGPSVGIWQIRTLKADTGKGTSRDISHLQGSVTNQAAAALSVLKSSGPSAWSTYTSGSYLKYTQTAASGATSANASYQQTGNWLGWLDPWTNLIPGGGSGALGGVVGSAGGAVASALWSSIQPFATTALFAFGGVALVVIGVTVLAKPVRDASNSATQQIGQTALMAA